MKKNANLPALIFMFALLIVWQCIAMGMNAAYILPSADTGACAPVGAAQTAVHRTFAGHHAVYRSRPCDLDRASVCCSPS